VKSDKSLREGGEPVFPYDTLVGKRPEAVAAEIAQLQTSLALTVERGTAWLIDRIEPSGPVASEPSVSLVYKTLWALTTVPGHQESATQLLDWLQAHAVRDTGDIFFPEEPAAERDDTRGYRQATILRCAATLEHPLSQDAAVSRRMRNYQSAVSGGAFVYIGEDAKSPDYPDDCNVGDTAFLGEYGLADDDQEVALGAGRWLLSVIQQNAEPMKKGRFYWHTDGAGTIITAVRPEDEITHIVRRDRANQMGWVIGCGIAFLADLYDTLRGSWSQADEATPYLDAALALLAFEDEMPYESYFYPSKCKVAWGAGVLSKVLIKHGLASEELLDKIYRAGKRSYLYTFLGTQRADGSWSDVYYPSSSGGPEVDFDYRLATDINCLPVDPDAPYESATGAVLNGIEITGEFIAELEYLKQGIEAMRGHLAESVSGVVVSASGAR
jgi:hypothetical protein